MVAPKGGLKKSADTYSEAGDALLVIIIHHDFCVALSPVRLHLGPPLQRAHGGLWPDG